MKQLFVVDDTQILGKNIERHLGDFGVSCTFCSNAIYAIETLQQLENVDLILVNPAMTLQRIDRNNIVPFLDFLEQQQLLDKTRLIIPEQATEWAKNISLEIENWPKDEILFERVQAFLAL